MKNQGLINKFTLFPVATVFLLSSSALAENVVTPTVATPQNHEVSEVESSNSMTRGFTWDSSFDKAADATKAAEIELKQGVRVECETPEMNENPALKAQCLRMARDAAGFAEEAAGIRRMQYIFADASRASDLAAVGSIGAIGYSELMKKNPSQASSLYSVANIQDTAGTVSYVSGAADFSMGAYAYLAQKQKLEKMKEVLDGTNGGLKMSSSDSAVVSKIAAAAELTKKAAYNHMLYGAGKVAVGYASKKLAQYNRNQADKLSSISLAAYAGQTYQYTSPASNSSGGTAYYQNNNPQFLASTNSNTGSSGTGEVVTIPSSASAASGLPSAEFRGLATANGKGQAVSGLGAGLGGGGSKGGGGEEAEVEGEPAAADPAKAAMGESFEMNLTGGGGGSRYGGGGKTAEEDSGGSGLFGSVLGGAATGSSATGVNPHSIYRDAMNGLDGSEQGNMAGVNGKDISLFQAVKFRYNKMMEGGRLQGPGDVQVRN